MAERLLREIPPAEVRRRLAGGGLRLLIGPVAIRLRGGDQAFADTLCRMYSATPVLEDDEPPLTQFDLRLVRPKGVRRWWKPTIDFVTDIRQPMAPFPLNHAFPLWEWGLNWVLAMQFHQFWMLHSAVLERDGHALVMPAEPGCGKSTLAAALMFRGWRLLSDEFGLIRPGDSALQFYPLPRPVPLKNDSIPLIRGFAPEAVIGPTFPKTRKGDVAHVAPPEEAQLRRAEPAKPAWVVFPRYQAGARAELVPMPLGRAFLQVSGNSFNYPLQGARSFTAAWALLRGCEVYQMRHGDLDEAVELLAGLRPPVEARDSA